MLATSTRREKALAYLQQTDVERYFTAAVFGPEVARPKPAPDIFLAAAAAIHADPAHCVVLEDSPNGLQAAKAAGCPAIVVPDLTPAPAESEHLWNYPCKRPARGTANFAEGTRKTIRSTIMEYVIGALLLASFFGLQSTRYAAAT